MKNFERTNPLSFFVEYGTRFIGILTFDIPGQSHPIGSDRNSSEVVGILGIGFRQ